ncbi:MAG: hypothetical protein HY867_16195 [Chloroflexi bacterium]|nr:hypothetical protein [Chloroflexota bacterium]
MSETKKLKLPQVGLNNNDWLSNTMRRFNLKPWTAGILMLFFNLALDLSLAFGFGAFYPGAKTHGLSREPIVWASDFLAQPFLVGYFCWIQTVGNNLLTTLISEGIIERNSVLNEITIKYQSWLRNRWLSRIVTTISFLCAVFFAWATPGPSDPTYTGWISVSPILPWARAIPAFITLYVLLMFSFDLAIIIKMVNEVFGRLGIRVEPFHPDNAGGLGIIGRFIASLGILIGALGVEVSASLLSTNAPNGVTTLGLVYFQKLLGLILYIIFAPTLFYLTINSARRAMIKYRDSLLKNISTMINVLLKNLQKSDSLDTEVLESLIKKLRLLEEEHKIVSQFPVWPFNKNNLRKFISLVTGPIIPSVTSIGIDLITRLINI